MKLHKMFLVQSPAIADGSTAQVIIDGAEAHLVIFDGVGTARFEFNLMSEEDKTRLAQTLAGLTKALHFLQKEAGLPLPSLKLGLLRLGQTILGGRNPIPGDR